MARFAPKNTLPALGGLLGAALLIGYAPAAAEGAMRGLSACGRVILPAVFPFLAVSVFLAGAPGGAGLAALLSGVMRYCFRLPAAAAPALLMSWIGGYPAGAKTLALLFSDSAPKAEPTPTPDPNALPILVNRTHPVDASYRPADLVQLKDVLPSSLVTVKGSDCEGDRTAAQALITMFEAAKADGVTGWQISAGYRSVKYQQKLFDRQVAEYQNQGLSVAKAKSAASKLVADPGASEHHTGLAFDITVAGTTFKGTEQQKWLQKHCWDYGFIIRYQEDKEAITGFLAECWHIRYVGVQHSVVMRDKNLCLEEYLGETD